MLLMKKSFYEWCIENSKEHLLIEWDSEKNQELGPRDISYGFTQKIWWKCPKCNQSYHDITSHRREGRDCPNEICRKGKQANNIKKALIERRGSLLSRYPDLSKEWHPLKNGELTPNNISPASDIQVWWLGTCNHEWEATPSNRVRLHSACPVCNNKVILIGYNDLATTNIELCTEWDYEKNNQLLPTNVVAGTNKKVWWICEKGHSFKASVSNRAKKNGTGCPDCGMERKSSFTEKVILYYLKLLFNDIQENYRPHFLKKKELDIFIPSLSLAIEYDGEYYHQNILKDIKKNELCEENGIDLIRIREPNCPLLPTKFNHFVRKTLKENELKDCIEFIITYVNDKFQMNLIGDIDIERDRSKVMEMYLISEKPKSLAITNPDLAKEWHPIKNGNLSSENISYSSNKNVWWLGNCGHEWVAQVNNRLNGSGCPKCYEATGRKIVHRRSLKKGINDLATENPQLAKEWHPNKNDNLLPSDLLCGSKKLAWWLGNCGHEWEAIISSRSKGVGCPYCTNRKVLAGFNDLLTKNPYLAKEWHPSKNIDINPSDVIANTDKKVWWLCECGHEWVAKVASRNRDKGTGCPNCAGITKKTIEDMNIFATLLNGKCLSKVYINTDTKLLWQCKNQHTWESTPYLVTKKGKWCPYCAKNKKESPFLW